MHKLLAAMGVTIAVLSLTAVLARPVPRAWQEAPPPEAQESLRALRVDATAVRLLLGVGDGQPQPWNGKVAVDRGEILGVEGWRLRATGKVTGVDSWQARSLIGRVADGPNAAPKKATAKKKGAASKKAAGGGANLGPLVIPTGVIVSLKAPLDATLTLSTDQGDVRIPLADLAGHSAKRYLQGRVEAQIVPGYAPLVLGSGQEDFPAAANDGTDRLWITYVDHQPRGPVVMSPMKDVPEGFKSFIPDGGGDQVKLLHFDGKSAGEPLNVTGPGRDVWKPAVAIGSKGEVIVVWSENNEGNWDLYARTYTPEKKAWTDPRRLTTDPGADTDPVLASYGKGPAGTRRVGIAWQAWRDGQADILFAPLDRTESPINISENSANDWSPAIAASPRGPLFIAFDSYRNANHDVFLCELNGEGKRLITVADSPRFEARPTVQVDAQGRPWVAYEERTVNWGKDSGKFAQNPGTPLYQASAVRVRYVEGEKVLDTGDPLEQAPQTLRPMNSFSRIALDHAGQPWLLFRHRQETNWRNSPVPVVGSIWHEYVTALGAKGWLPPTPLPRSDNLLDNRPALVPTSDGPVLAIYSSDGRLHREGVSATGVRLAAEKKKAANQGRYINNDIFIAALNAPVDLGAPRPGEPIAANEPAPVSHPDEAADIARLRAHRVTAGGKTYQLFRGEFHRHTEISPDGGGDGSLEDMWRYALDTSALDWVGCGDHDNGNGREYTWWLTQKTTDLYHHAPTFVPMFTYERSVNYPGGHRNVMFPTRGVRTLPRLTGETGPRIDVNGRDEDALMLYKYLRELGGICASHTSATDMGTDWRENDPLAEPFVEIYQGDRDSYEHLGAPRVARTPEEAAGGWRPLGMVWNALAMQYRLGFQASSDHVSTHISFAIAIAEKPTREAIFDAFRKRHCYAATDNILLDVRCGEHLLGDEFTLDGPVALSIQAHGTGSIKRIDIIKDFNVVYTTEPKSARVDFQWTDEDGKNLKPSWYYVRVLQENGELAWGSPMWIHKSEPAR